MMELIRGTFSNLRIAILSGLLALIIASCGSSGDDSSSTNSPAAQGSTDETPPNAGEAEDEGGDGQGGQSDDNSGQGGDDPDGQAGQPGPQGEPGGDDPDGEPGKQGGEGESGENNQEGPEVVPDPNLPEGFAQVTGDFELEVKNYQATRAISAEDDVGKLYDFKWGKQASNFVIKDDKLYFIVMGDRIGSEEVSGQRSALFSADLSSDTPYVISMGGDVNAPKIEALNKYEDQRTKWFDHFNIYPAVLTVDPFDRNSDLYILSKIQDVLVPVKLHKLVNGQLDSEATGKGGRFGEFVDLKQLPGGYTYDYSDTKLLDGYLYISFERSGTTGIMKVKLDQIGKIPIPAPTPVDFTCDGYKIAGKHGWQIINQQVYALVDGEPNALCIGRLNSDESKLQFYPITTDVQGAPIAADSLGEFNSVLAAGGKYEDRFEHHNYVFSQEKQIFYEISYLGFLLNSWQIPNFFTPEGETDIKAVKLPPSCDGRMIARNPNEIYLFCGEVYNPESEKYEGGYIFTLTKIKSTS